VFAGFVRTSASVSCERKQSFCPDADLQNPFKDISCGWL